MFRKVTNNGGVNGGVNTDKDEVFKLIRNLPGINTRRIKEELSMSQRTVELLIKQLREETEPLWIENP